MYGRDACRDRRSYPPVCRKIPRCSGGVCLHDPGKRKLRSDSIPLYESCCRWSYVPSIHLYMRPFHTSLHASLPYISTCVPPIHLYMRPFHTSLNASLPYISTCVPFIHVGIIFTRARPPRRDVEMWKGRMLCRDVWKGLSNDPIKH